MPAVHFMLTLALGATAIGSAAAQSCRVRSAPGPAPQLVELYTSEGCSSCPPADRWLSTLQARRDVVALGFHVNYWDYIGWRDRFATDATTERQKSHRSAWGARQVYTPQVVADGRDWPSWHQGLPARSQQAAPVALELERQGDRLRARVSAASGPGVGAALAGFWVVLEDGHTSRVRAGENAGATLRHDRVVRDYRPLAAWPAAAPAEFALELPAADPAHPRRVVFVVHDTTPQRRPLQVLELAPAC
jgi:hypothetical protein